MFIVTQDAKPPRRQFNNRHVISALSVWALDFFLLGLSVGYLLKVF